jgi:hypothetical protein
MRSVHLTVKTFIIDADHAALTSASQTHGRAWPRPWAMASAFQPPAHHTLKKRAIRAILCSMSARKVSEGAALERRAAQPASSANPASLTVRGRPRARGSRGYVLGALHGGIGAHLRSPWRGEAVPPQREQPSRVPQAKRPPQSVRHTPVSNACLCSRRPGLRHHVLGSGAVGRGALPATAFNPSGGDSCLGLLAPMRQDLPQDYAHARHGMPGALARHAVCTGSSCAEREVPGCCPCRVLSRVLSNLGSLDGRIAYQRSMAVPGARPPHITSF